MWGPTLPDMAPVLTSVRVRRYKCADCCAARTVLPRGIGRRLRYSLSAIALALTAWAVWLRPAVAVRADVSPWPRVGPSEIGRWRSLRQWARRAVSLFKLPAAADSTTRQRAARAAQLVRVRGPTGTPEGVRVVIGAHVS